MNRHQRRAAIAVAAGAGFLALGAGSAKALPFTVGPTTGFANQTLTFDQFDPADGTLTGVEFTLSGVATSIAGEFQLSGAEGGTGSSSTSATFSVLAPGDGGPLGVMLGSGGLLLSCSADNVLKACTDTDTVTTLSTPFLSPVTLTDPLDLAAYAGAGTFDVDMTILALSFLSPCTSGAPPDPECSLDVTVSWSGDLGVRFLFEKPDNPPGGGDVPEPGALLFLALGLPALARLRAASR